MEPQGKYALKVIIAKQVHRPKLHARRILL